MFGTGARLVCRDDAALPAARAVVDEVLAGIDLAANRFREDSEISALNRADGRPVRGSALFLRLVTVALEAAASTHGAVDPTLGAVLQDLGYDRTFREVARSGVAPRVMLRRTPGWRAVEVDAAAMTVRLPPGVRLDLGATAKAKAVDDAVDAAFMVTGVPMLLSLGGDLAVAGAPPGQGWPVLLSEDSATAPDSAGPVVVVRSGGLATSSTTVRRWRRGGTTMHHLLDPSTGLPTAGPWRTVTVAAPTCTEANVAATAAVVLGNDAVAWLGERGLPARLVTQAGALRTVAGWPQEL